MGLFACCTTSPPVRVDPEPFCDISGDAALDGHAKGPGPNAKVVAGLARAATVDITAQSGGARTINERLQRLACSDGAASMSVNSSFSSVDYMEVIDADPLGREQLAAPHNAYSEFTCQGRAAPSNLGAPLPAANDARVATLLSIGPVAQPPPARIEPILAMASNILGLGSIMVSLLDGDKQFVVKSASGFVPPGTMLTPPGVCHWSLVPQVHQMVVVEDALLDARTHQNSIVAGPPHIRFYCGAPLVASNGHRLGMLCAADKEPRKFDKERAGILCNLAELVVRELEASWAAQYQRRHSEKLLRAMSCYTEPFMFVDVAAQRWSILHINEAVTEKTGITRDDMATKGFWDLFRLDGSSAQPWKTFAQEAANSSSFGIEGARLKSEDGPGERTFNVVFRPAAMGGALEGSLMIGVPAGAFSLPGKPLSYYLVVLKPGGTPLPAQRALPFEGLKLGQQLGKGSYGRVFRGMYMGRKVAVKLVEDASNVRLMRDGRPVESALTEGLSHPGVCKLLAHKLVPKQARRASYDGGKGGGSGEAASPRRRSSHDGTGTAKRAAASELWLILEYCDRGSVQDAVDKGWFREQPSIEAAPCARVIAATAAEVASAMAFLHAKGIIHGDLTGGNVLLRSAPTAPHGFAAKVADFGLVRDFSIVSRLETRTYGTMTHMAPEVLTCDTLSKASDVYSFGVILWELCSGQRAWAGMNFAQVIHAVAIEHKRLQPPEDTQPQLARLMRSCLAREPAKRPTFAALAPELQRLCAELAGSIREE